MKHTNLTPKQELIDLLAEHELDAAARLLRGINGDRVSLLLAAAEEHMNPILQSHDPYRLREIAEYAEDIKQVALKAKELLKDA